MPPGLRAIAQQYLAGVNLSADARARFENFVATVLNPGANQASSPLLVVTRLTAPDRNGWPIIALRIAGRIKSHPLTQFQQEEAIIGQNMQTLMLCNENQVPAQPADLPASIFANCISGDIFDAPGLYYRSGMACAGAAPVTKPVALANRGLTSQPLQIQSVGDPQTPYAGSLAMQRIMRSHLITVGGGDHGQLGRANPALDAALTQYLRTGHTSVSRVGEPAITTPLQGYRPGAGPGTGAGSLW